MNNRNCCYFFALVLVLCASFAHGQGLRWDLGAPGSAGAVTASTIGGLPALLATPGVTLNWCNYPANALPCTNFATTYNSLTLAVPCPNNAQVVLQGSSSCQATSDFLGNMGAYVPTNTVCTVTCYSYTLTINGISYGPYLVTLGGGGGSGGGGISGLVPPCITKATSATSIGCGSQNDDGSHAVTSPNGIGLQTTGGLTFDATNDTVTGTAANLFACKSGTAGRVLTCSTSTNTGVLGTALAGRGTTPGISGSTSVCFAGNCSVIMDNNSTIGDYCIPSGTVAGNCHDTGSATPSAGVSNFLVLQAVSAGQPATIQIMTPDWFAQQIAASIVHGISFTIFSPTGLASGTTIASVRYITVPWACTIKAWNLVIDTGTITVKFWKVATGTAIPTSGNSINTSGVAISAGTAIHSTTLTDFTTTAVAANDIMAMDITAVASANYVNGVLQCQ